MVKPQDQPQSDPTADSAPATDQTTTGLASSAVAHTAAKVSQSKPTPVKPQGYAHLFKYVLVGDSGCGKSALLRRYCQDSFDNTYNLTIGVDFAVKTIELDNGDQAKLQIWDTAGQERFRTVTNSYYRGAHGIFIVYDVNDSESFQAVGRWLNEAERFCNEDTFAVIIGNKSDLKTSSEKYYGEDQVLNSIKDEGFKVSDGTIGESTVIGVFETSAKTGEGVVEAFKAMATPLVTRRLNERNSLRGAKNKKKQGHETVQLSKATNKPKSRCC